MSRTSALRSSLPGLALAAASVLPSMLGLSAEPGGVPTAPPAPAASAAVSGQPRIFFGSLHAHTKYSDGSGTPADAFTQARDQGRLDFLAVTEHNHDQAERGIGSGDSRKDGIMIATTPTLYKDDANAAALVSAAKSFTVADRFVAIAGQEFSTISSGNHANVFDVSAVINVANGDYKGLYDTWLAQNKDSLNEPPLVQFNHPDFRADENPNTTQNQRVNDYGLDDFGGNFDELIKSAEKFVSLIEIVSGPALKDGVNLNVGSGNRHEKDYWFYLNKGFHIAPAANQDNHFFTWGTITRARTAVLADRLTFADLLRAIKARRVYATEDNNLQIRFRVNGQLMGSIVRTPQPMDVSIEVEISDPDEPNAEYKVELYRDDIGGAMIADSVDEVTLEGNGTATFTQRYETGKTFFFIKVIQNNVDGRDDFAWTAPVWIEPGQPDAPPVTPTPTGPQAGTMPFVHSRRSDKFHFSNCIDAARIKPENRLTSDTPPEDKTMHHGCPRVP